MNIKRIHSIIIDVLNTLGVTELAMKPTALLIGMTFKHGTDFYSNEKNWDRYLGMMHVDKEEAEWFIRSYIKPNRDICLKIYNAALVDIENDDTEDVVRSLDFNLALQVAYVYYSFKAKNNGIDPESLEESVSRFKSIWPELSTGTINSLAAAYSKGSGLYHQ